MGSILLVYRSKEVDYSHPIVQVSPIHHDLICMCQSGLLGTKVLNEKTLISKPGFGIS